MFESDEDKKKQAFPDAQEGLQAILDVIRGTREPKSSFMPPRTKWVICYNGEVVEEGELKREGDKNETSQ